MDMSALNPPPADAGRIMAPRRRHEEVTPDMIEAGLQAFVEWDDDSEGPGALMARIYLAMVEARPA
jgi:hypothetical protein